ncbi:Radial spoke head protein 4 A [Paramecium bursaria]
MQKNLDDIFNTQYKGKSLFQHLVEIALQIQENKYFNIQGTLIELLQDLSYFEDLSHFIKEQRFYYLKLKSAEEINNPVEPEFPWTSFLEQQLQLLNIKSPSLNATIQYFPKLNQLLNIIGYGFSDEDAHNIQLCLKKIAQADANIKTLRFWGKILASQNDYYVIEATLYKPYTEPMPPDYDERTNEYVHYVAHDLLGDWILLPIINRKQLESSRLITYIFTGDLNRAITQYPTFEGQEKHMLKAQILRITHSTLLAPRGLYKTNDDDPKLIAYEEEFKMPEIAELAGFEAWVHQPANLLKMGRITHYVDPQLPEAEKQTLLEQLQTEDPEVERLRAIVSDAPTIKDIEQNWYYKTHGETQPFTGLEEGTLGYQVIQLRNYSWPGTVTVANAQEFGSLYVGYGLKNQVKQFNPIAPKDIQEEPEDIIEFPEPNPQTQADEVEPDSDDERRRQQELLQQDA